MLIEERGGKILFLNLKKARKNLCETAMHSTQVEGSFYYFTYADSTKVALFCPIVSSVEVTFVHQFWRWLAMFPIAARSMTLG